MKVTKFAERWNDSRVAKILGKLSKDELMEIAIASGLDPSHYTTKFLLKQGLIAQLRIPR